MDNSSSASAPHLSSPTSIFVQPGPLGITVSFHHGFGMVVTKVNDESKLRNRIFKGDYIVQFEGLDLQVGSIQQFQQKVLETSKNSNRCLVFRSNLRNVIDVGTSVSDEGRKNHNMALSSSLNDANPTPTQHAVTTAGETSTKNQFSIIQSAQVAAQNYYDATTRGTVTPNYVNGFAPTLLTQISNSNVNSSSSRNDDVTKNINTSNSISNSNSHNANTNNDTPTSSQMDGTTKNTQLDSNSSSNKGHVNGASTSSSIPSTTTATTTKAIANTSTPRSSLVTDSTHTTDKTVSTKHNALKPVANSTKSDNITNDATTKNNSNSSSSSSSSSNGISNSSKENNNMNHSNSINKVFDYSCKCDICDMHDGYSHMYMQRCKTCGIYVHEECYCLLKNDEYKEVKFPDWECWACLSVGKTITVRDKDSTTKSVTIKERPSHCALCPIQSGTHAMHPLYDKHDKDGQPLIKGDTTEWVHTLCALFLSSYKLNPGLVYGCNEVGGFNSRNEKIDENEEELEEVHNEYYDFRYLKDDEEVLTASPHHFVITSAFDGASVTSLNMLKDLRDLKCFECNNPDHHCKRIVVQCLKEECCRACHVGCAKWNNKSLKRLLFFFPGNDTDEDHMEFYCKKHAIVKKDQSQRMKSKKKKADSNDNNEEEDGSDRADNSDNESDFFDSDSSDLASPPPKMRKLEKQSSIGTVGGETFDAASNIAKPALKKRKVEKQVSTDSLGPKNKKKSRTAALIEGKVNRQVAIDTLGQKNENNSKYFEKKRRLQKTFEDMSNALSSAIVVANKKGRDVASAIKGVKVHFMRHANLTKKEFNDLWNKCHGEASLNNAVNMSNGMLSGRMIGQKTDEFRSRSNTNNQTNMLRKKEVRNRWLKLFVPFYDDGAISIDDEQFSKRVEITEAEFEKDIDETMISF